MVMHGHMAMVRGRVREREHGSFCYVCFNVLHLFIAARFFPSLCIQGASNLDGL